MFAIAAVSRNGIIGRGNTIPWRITEEFKWFRRMTMGHAVIMGRKTFESLPKPLDGRVNVVLTRHPRRLLSSPTLAQSFSSAVEGAAAHSLLVPQLGLPGLQRADVRVACDVSTLIRAGVADRAWLIGGAQIYEQFLRYCSELYLSVIDRDVEGDVRFPEFKHLFDLQDVVADHAEFRVFKYVRNGNCPTLQSPVGAKRKKSRVLMSVVRSSVALTANDDGGSMSSSEDSGTQRSQLLLPHGA